MKDLITASGLSKGAFYHYFVNKEALYFAVIDNFFLCYFNNVDWDKFNDLTFEEIEPRLKKNYIQFVKEISKFSEKGLSKYYVMFFQAYELHPKFLKTIQNFYLQLEKKIDHAIKRENITHIKAINIISKYEGILFWLSIFPEDKLEKLINEL
jgi:AcrR family transcriptional regulator